MTRPTLSEILAALVLSAHLARQHARLAHLHAEIARVLVSL